MSLRQPEYTKTEAVVEWILTYAPLYILWLGWAVAVAFLIGRHGDKWVAYLFGVV